MSTVPVKAYRKAAIERRRLYLDYSCWLEDPETLTDFQVTVIPYTEEAPIVVTNGYTDADAQEADDVRRWWHGQHQLHAADGGPHRCRPGQA